ncbi:unnamed protein product [Ectocarpus sp. 6 AP-2014]
MNGEGTRTGHAMGGIVLLRSVFVFEHFSAHTQQAGLWQSERA